MNAFALRDSNNYVFDFIEFNSQHYASMLTLNVTLKEIKIYLGYQRIIKLLSVFKFYGRSLTLFYIYFLKQTKI